VIFTDTTDFEQRRNRLFRRGIQIDFIVIREWSEIVMRSESNQPLFSAIKDGHVGVFQGISRGVLSSYKHTFELLSDPEYEGIFDAEVTQALSRHVPWTRVLRDRTTSYHGQSVDLLAFVADHRERFVLKPSGGSGGSNVLLGWQCSQDDWTRSLIRGVRTHVVQERAFPKVQPYPVSRCGLIDVAELKSDLCPFIVNGTAKGCYVRVTDSDIFNPRFGGTSAPVWILEEES